MSNIEEYLINKNIKASNKGFDCLVEAITLIQKDKTYLRAITSRLYPDIANNLGDTPSRVERAIRHSISIGKSQLTNSEFIARAVLDLRNNR